MANTLKIERHDTKDGQQRYRVTVVSDGEKDLSAIVTVDTLHHMLDEADDNHDHSL